MSRPKAAPKTTFPAQRTGHMIEVIRVFRNNKTTDNYTIWLPNSTLAQAKNKAMQTRPDDYCTAVHIRISKFKPERVFEGASEVKLSQMAIDNAKFRVKPEPRTVWLVTAKDPWRGTTAKALLDKNQAEAFAATRPGAIVTEYREVIE